MEKQILDSLNITAENITKIAELFPSAVSEGKINFEILKTLLGETIDDSNERYQFSWNGKHQAMQLAQTPSTGTLLPNKEKSKNWDETDNVYIEGDNLEVLKLLQKSYFGKIKMIYIDPPYNTGKDFVYKDSFQDTIQNYKEQTNQTTKANAETSGRYHTDWLNMMYPRLMLARNLLTEDGVIFISIDDNEQANLKKMCDEIFGEDNFVNVISVNMKNIAGASGGGEDKKFKKNIEYLYIYAKNYNFFPIFEGAYEYTEIGSLVKEYKEKGISWKYNTILYDAGEKIYLDSTVDGDGNEIAIYNRKNPVYKSINQIVKEENINESEVYAKYGKKIFQTAMPQSSIRPRVMKKLEELNFKNDLLSIEYTPKTGRNKGSLYEQFYKGENCRLFAWLKDVSEERDGKLYKKDLQGTYWDYASSTKNLTKEGGVVFQNGKKPMDLLTRIISLYPEKDFITLDFFSGSSTTAHAVMKLNVEDSGNRKYIMVQIPENIDNKSDEGKLGYSTITELAQERIRRAGELILNDDSLSQENRDNLDTGFKVFTLDSSNVKPFDSTQLFADAETFVEGRSELAICYELILKSGLALTTPIQQRDGIYVVDEGLLFISLADQITVETAEAIINLADVDLNPRVIFKDTGFSDDATKLNVLRRLQTAGISEVRSV